MRRVTVFGAAILAAVIAHASDPPSTTPVPPRVAASLFGGACTHDYAVSTAGTQYCNCSATTIYIKDNGGGSDTNMITCATVAKCQYPENDNCTGT